MLNCGQILLLLLLLLLLLGLLLLSVKQLQSYSYSLQFIQRAQTSSKDATGSATRRQVLIGHKLAEMMSLAVT